MSLHSTKSQYHFTTSYDHTQVILQHPMIIHRAFYSILFIHRSFYSLLWLYTSSTLGANLASVLRPGCYHATLAALAKPATAYNAGATAALGPIIPAGDSGYSQLQGWSWSAQASSWRLQLHHIIVLIITTLNHYSLLTEICEALPA